MKRTTISRYIVMGNEADVTNFNGYNGKFYKTKQQARDLRDSFNWQPHSFPDKPYRVVRVNIEIIEVDGEGERDE